MDRMITNLGTIGLIADIPGYALPPAALTTMNNVRTQNEALQSMFGHESFINPSNAPYHIRAITNVAATIQYILYGADAFIGAHDGTTEADISGLALSASKIWNSTVINNSIVFNNTLDIPRYWNPTVGTGTDFVSIPEFTSFYGATKMIRSFKGYLFAIGVSVAGNAIPSRLAWSSQGVKDPNNADLSIKAGIPQKWDFSDIASGAGFNDFGDANARLLDGAALRETFFIYSETQTFSMRFIGGAQIWDFDDIFDDLGLLAAECVVEFKNQHFCVTDGDVRVHNGHSWQSIIDGRNRKLLFDNLDVDNYQNTFVVKDTEEDEIWICYPEQGNELPSRALIWNYTSNTWSARELPATAHIATSTEITGQGLTWESASANFTWRSATDIKWGQQLFNPSVDILLSASPDVAGSNIFKMNVGLDFNGVPRTAVIERDGFMVGEQEGYINCITAVYPIMAGNPVVFEIGAQFVAGGPVTFEGPFNFDPNTDFKFDCRVSGRYHVLRMSTDETFRLSGIRVEYEQAGER